MFELILLFSLTLYAYVWVYNQDLCKHRKAWNPSLPGMNSNRFTLGLASGGQRSHGCEGSSFCRVPSICEGLNCVPYKVVQNLRR